MPETDVSIRFGEATLHFKMDREKYKKLSVLAKDMYGHGGVKVLFEKFALQFLEKYDGKGNKMDNYFGSNFIPKPEIDDDIETKTLPWLRTRDTNELARLKQNLFASYVFSSALYDINPNERATAELQLNILCKKYL